MFLCISNVHLLMQKKFINVGLPVELEEDIKEAVKLGKATNKTDLIKKAITKYLSDSRSPSITGGVALQDDEGRITAFGLRYVLISLQLMASIKKTCTDKHGADMCNILFYESAKNAGRNTGLRMQRSLGKTAEEGLFSHTKLAKAFGWGRSEIKKTESGYNAKLYYSWEAEAYVEMYQRSESPVCTIISGLLSGIASVALGKECSTTETKCFAKGDPYCEFELT